MVYVFCGMNYDHHRCSFSAGMKTSDLQACPGRGREMPRRLQVCISSSYCCPWGEARHCNPTSSRIRRGEALQPARPFPRPRPGQDRESEVFMPSCRCHQCIAVEAFYSHLIKQTVKQTVINFLLNPAWFSRIMISHGLPGNGWFRVSNV